MSQVWVLPEAAHSLNIHISGVVPLLHLKGSATKWFYTLPMYPSSEKEVNYFQLVCSIYVHVHSILCDPGMCLWKCVCTHQLWALHKVSAGWNGVLHPVGWLQWIIFLAIHQLCHNSVKGYQVLFCLNHLSSLCFPWVCVYSWFMHMIERWSGVKWGARKGVDGI